MRWTTRLVPAAAVAMALALPQEAEATDGHFLHGVGAVNSAMGGAGIAAPVSLLGTFYLNPAGLMAYDGTRIEFGFEMFKPERTIASDFGVPGMAGSTTSKSDFTPIPAMGWSTKINEQVAVGLGLLAIGGFGVDYPTDPTNPILGPRPFGGFGQIFSNYGLMKITPSVAFAATEQLWIGFAANIDYANLTVDPMPIGAPAVDPGPDGIPMTLDDRAFYSSASAADGAFGFGFQAGFIFHVNDMISVGGMYQHGTSFEDFEFNTTWANPNIAPPAPNAFGFPRTINFNLDVPAVVGGGLSIKPLPQLLLAGDYRYMMYSSTDGFQLPDGAPSPFNADGSVSGFGWDDISSIHIGADFRASDQVSLRAGYNVSQNPVPDSLAMINLPAPAIVKNHITFGIGVRPSRRFEINAAYYRAFENSGTGPILNPAAPPGATVTNTLSENSFLLQFTWATRGSL